MRAIYGWWFSAARAAASAAARDTQNRRLERMLREAIR